MGIDPDNEEWQKFTAKQRRIKEINDSINRPMGPAYWAMLLVVLLGLFSLAAVIQVAPYGWDWSCLFARCVKVVPK